MPILKIDWIFREKSGWKHCHIWVVCHSCVVRYIEPCTPILVLFVHCSLPNRSQIKSNHFLKLDHNYSSTKKGDLILCPFYLSDLCKFKVLQLLDISGTETINICTTKPYVRLRVCSGLFLNYHSIRWKPFLHVN